MHVSTIDRSAPAPGRLAWLGAAAFVIACLTSTTGAAAQDSSAGMWVPARKTTAAPATGKPGSRSTAPSRTSSSVVASSASDKGASETRSGGKAPAGIDSAGLQLQRRLEMLERTAREQSSAIASLLATLGGAPHRDSIATPAPAPARTALDAQRPKADAEPVVPEKAPARDSGNAKSAASEPATVETLARSVERMARHLDSLQNEIVAVDKRGQQRVSGLGNFRFSGDVRMRYEPTFQGGGTVTRHRERTRARLHITGATGGELTGGLSIATGAFEEPTTENQTHTGFFTRKTMAFERFFITYKPHVVPGLSLTAGKFPTPWSRTPLTLSNDLYPEGVSGSFKTPIRNSHVDEVSLVGFWLPMLEVSGGPDSYLNGGQLQTKFKLDARTKAAASLAVVKAVGADAVATAVAAGTFKPSWPTSNTVRTDSAGKVVGFAHGFTLNDYIVSAEHAFAPAWPVAISANAVRNTLAAAGNRNGFLGEVRVGTTGGVGRAQFGYSYYRIQRDAVLSAFNVTDIRLGSNSVGHIAQATWKLRSDLVAGLTGYFGRVLDPTSTPGLVAPDFRAACKTEPFTGCRDPLWSRLQFDFVYSF